MTALSRLALLLPALAAASVAHGAALTPWYGRLGDGEARVMPQVHATAAGRVDPAVYVQGSYAGHFDMLVGVGGALSTTDDSAFDRVEVMPRVFLTDSLGAGLRASIDPASATSSLAPEVHGVARRGRLTLAVNLGYDRGTTFARLAPEVELASRVSVFAELNPAVDLDGSAALAVVPGLGLGLDRAGHHGLSLGVTVATLTPADPLWGLRYTARFGG